MRVPQVSERIKEAPAQALRGVFAGIGQLLLITDKLRHKTPGHEDGPRARAPETAPAITDAAVTSPAGSHQETTTPAAAEPAAGSVVTAEPAEAPPVVEAAPIAEAPPIAEAAPAAADPAGAEAAKPPKRQRTRNFDKTGNVRLLADETASVAEPIAAEPIAVPEPIATFEPTVVAEPVVVPEPVIVSEAAPPEPIAAVEPMPAPEPPAPTGPAATPEPVAEAPLPNYDALTVASLRARLRNLDIAQVRRLAEYERAHAGRPEVLGMYERRITKLEAEA
jgi:hypothetical protein